MEVKREMEIEMKVSGVNENQGEDGEGEGDTSTIVIRKEKLQIPKKYKVLLHNDDYTTMEFVVMILIKIFHKTLLEAQEIMLAIHTKGVGAAGIYTYEVAETKQLEVKRLAREQGHPLRCTLEPE